MKPKIIELRINGCRVPCEYVDVRVYAGEIQIYENRAGSDSIWCHVEVIAVKTRKDGLVMAKNAMYERRLEAWYHVNHEGENPQTVKIKGLGQCFIHMEVFAK